MRISFLIAGLALAAGFIVAIYLMGGADPEPETLPVPAPNVPDSVTTEPVSPQPAPIEPTPRTPEPEREPAVVIPELSESDDFVRAVFTESTLPETWLGREDLLRRAAVVIDNAAGGEYPRRQLGFLAPDGKFKVTEIGDRVFIDPTGYQRWDRYLDMLESVEPDTLAGLAADVSPLLEEALRELGNDQTVLPQVLGAIDQVLAVPVLRGDVELVQPKVFFEYADPALEGLSPLQKQVLRMGPDNVVRLRSYLTEVRTGLLRR